MLDISDLKFYAFSQDIVIDKNKKLTAIVRPFYNSISYVVLNNRIVEYNGEYLNDAIEIYNKL